MSHERRTINDEHHRLGGALEMGGVSSAAESHGGGGPGAQSVPRDVARPEGDRSEPGDSAWRAVRQWFAQARDRARALAVRPRLVVRWPRLGHARGATGSTPRASAADDAQPARADGAAGADAAGRSVERARASAGA